MNGNPALCRAFSWSVEIEDAMKGRGRRRACLDGGTLAHLLGIMISLLHVALFQATRGDVKQAGDGAPKLTSVEKELLMWLAAGRTNSEMAQLRQRSPATICNQLEKLYAKLGVSTRAEAVAVGLSATQSVPPVD